MLTSIFFKNNRTQLQKNIGENQIIVLTAQALLQRTGDTTYPFRQDSNFFYLTGLDEPELVLVMAGGEEFLILPKRSEVETIFGGTIDRDKIAKTSGIITIYDYKEGWEHYKKLRNNLEKIYTLQAAPARVSGIDSFYTNPARRQLVQKLKRLAPQSEIHDIRPDLAAMRQIKQPEEIEAIKSAITITKRGFEIARGMMRPGTKEHEIEAEFDYHFKKQKAVHGYAPPIIASGENACVLHYCNGTRQLKTGEFVLMDIGAELDCYSADISRTYKVGTVSSRQASMYEAVVLVQKEALKLLQDGLDWREYAVQVDHIMGEQLIKLGLIKENIRTEVKRYFSHGIGHSLGLDVHDVCDYKTIQKNMVITVEPGIYVPEEGIGVRIEDDILITQTGAINLSANIPYV